jgi:ferredoxin
MGAGACAYALPALFAVGEDGKARVIGTVSEDDETVADIVGECPTAALRLVAGPAGDCSHPADVSTGLTGSAPA